MQDNAKQPNVFFVGNAALVLVVGNYIGDG